MGLLIGSEVDWWTEVCAGNKSAFAAIYDAHHDRVFNHALRHCRTAADAEDVTASTFLTLWAKRASVQLVDGSCLPWMLVTTTNHARNLFRKDRHFEYVDSPIEDLEISAQFDTIDRSELRADLQRALRRLRTADAQLVSLCALEGYSPSEVAPLLGLSAGNARVRLHRSLARLRPLFVLSVTSEGESRD